MNATPSGGDWKITQFQCILSLLQKVNTPPLLQRKPRTNGLFQAGCMQRARVTLPWARLGTLDLFLCALVAQIILCGLKAQCQVFN